MADTPDYNKMEKRKAKRDGVRLVNNSGRGQYSKGDAKDDNHLYDYKFTKNKTFSLNLEAFLKHRKDAWKSGLEGVIVVDFYERNHSVAIIDWDVLQGYMEIVENSLNDD